MDSIKKGKVLKKVPKSNVIFDSLLIPLNSKRTFNGSKIMVCINWKKPCNNVIEELKAESSDDALLKVGWKRLEKEIKKAKKTGFKGNYPISTMLVKNYSIKKIKELFAEKARKDLLKRLEHIHFTQKTYRLF